jgi:hypothetical protein
MRGSKQEMRLALGEESLGQRAFVVHSKVPDRASEQLDLNLGSDRQCDRFPNTAHELGNLTPGVRPPSLQRIELPEISHTPRVLPFPAFVRKRVETKLREGRNSARP